MLDMIQVAQSEFPTAAVTFDSHSCLLRLLFPDGKLILVYCTVKLVNDCEALRQYLRSVVTAKLKATLPPRRRRMTHA